MQTNRTWKIINSLIILVALVIFYIIFDRSSDVSKITEINNELQATTTKKQNININNQNTGTYTIEQVPVEITNVLPKPIPDLNRPVTLYQNSQISLEAKEISVQKVSTIQNQLRQNPNDFYGWLDLGIYQKMGGDYDGTVISWKYASKLAPNDYISLGNLGNLYAYFLNNLEESEKYYKEALIKGSTQPHLYTQLAEVYAYLFKNKEKAQAILDEGIKNIPGDLNLLQMKSTLK